jgi:hypothetical protein
MIACLAAIRNAERPTCSTRLRSRARTTQHAPLMADALVSVYVRPEGSYVTSSDRTTAGVWMESATWEFLPGDEPEGVGAAIIRRPRRINARIVDGRVRETTVG